MPLQTTTTIICDGDGQEITTEPLTMRDENGNTIYLHDYSCLQTYGTQKTQEKADKFEALKAEPLQTIQG